MKTATQNSMYSLLNHNLNNKKNNAKGNMRDIEGNFLLCKV